MTQKNQECRPTLGRRSILRTGITGIATIGVFGASLGTAAAETLTVGETGNVDFGSINDAIDAATPGDTVTVRPGTYSEDVVVDVSGLTITGTGNVVVRGSGSSSAAVSIDADDVTVERLRVQNPGGLLGIKSQSGHSSITIRSNRVSDVGPFGSLGVTGIISAADQTDLNVIDNTVSAIREDASGVAAQGIFIDNEDGTTADARIAANSVSDISAAYGAIGILLQVSGPTIENNTVSGLDGEVFAQGLNLDGNAGDTRIAVNTFDNVSGGQFPGEGIKIDGGNVSSFEITQNNLLPPVGLNNATSAKVSAECNYWNARSGPSPQGDGSEVVGPVDFTPWSVGRVNSSNANNCRGGQ